MHGYTCSLTVSNHRKPTHRQSFMYCSGGGGSGMDFHALSSNVRSSCRWSHKKNLGPQTFSLASHLWHKFSHGMARAHEGHALSPSHGKRQHVGHMYVRWLETKKNNDFQLSLHERWHICCATACGSADVFYAQGRSVSPLLYKRYTLRLSKNDFAEVAHGLCYKEYFAREASASDSTKRSSA